MTTIKISELVQATELSGSDVLPIVNGGSTKKVAVSSLFVLGDIPSLSAKWNSTYSTVNSLSDTWEESVLITPLQVASGSWDSVYSTTKSNSANWSNWSSVSASYALGSQYVKLSGDTMTGTLSVGAGGNLFSPSFATFVKNSSYVSLSSTLTNNSLYFNSLGTFASPGGFIIKGHSPTYDNIIRNLPGFGTYGLWIQNVDSMDPGSTFISDGRGAVTHAMSFRAGINNFTAGSDHNHVQWQGAPSNSTQAWQMTNGGSLSVYNYGSNTYSQRFLVHTLPQYQISTTIAAISGYFDTRNANLVTSTDKVSGVVILLDTTFGAGNYSSLNAGEVVGITLNPGLVGLAAVIYNSQCMQVSSNGGSLSAFQFDFYIGNNNNWVPAQKGIQAVNLQSRANGGNPGVSLITSQIGTNPNTQYVGITGCYRNMNKHALARFSTSSILTGFKPGSPLTLWIPTSMPSSIGTGFITSDKISTFAQGTFPTGVRTGYFDAFVINVSGTDMEFALCNLMDSYGFENRFWPISADGTAGWLLYGGTQDTVHRPTFGTTGFYFEREPWYFASPFNYLSGGMVKCVGLGNSEVYGDFSYGLGYRGAVLGKKSGTFAGDYNAVYSDNSVALGGEGLISLSSTPYQAVVGKYNNPVNNALFVVGAGGSDTNRVNVLEVESSKISINGSISAISLNVVSLSSRSIDLLHTPANDGTNPVFRIGELTSGSTTLSGFSGMFMSYNETSNIFGISAQFAPAPGVAAVSIDRNANVGIGTNAPNNKLTVTGNISAYEVYSSLAVLSSSNSTGGLGPVYLRISNSSGDANNNGGAISIDQDATTYGRIRSYYDNTYAGWRMSIGASLTPSIYMVNTSGNVGINTAAPSEKLTVSGNISGNGNLTVTGNVFGGTNINLTNGSTYTIQLSDNGGTIASSNSTVGLTAVPSSSITYPAGFQTSIIQLSTARVALSSNSVGLSINQANGYIRTTKQYSAATLLYTGTLGGWVLFGDVGA